MSLIPRMLGKIVAPWRMASTLANPQKWFIDFVRGNPDGKAGPVVNEATVLTFPIIYSCVSLIASTIAAMPFHVHRRVGPRREDAFDHPVDYLIDVAPNEDMTAMVAREAIIAHMLVWGNSYQQIVRKRNGAVDQLRILTPDLVKKRRDPSDGIVFDIYDPKTRQVSDTLFDSEVLHVHGLGFDGLLGHSPTTLAKTTIQAGMAQDEEAKNFITRGIRPPGALKMPGKFKSPADAKQFRDNWNALHQADDSGRQIIILEQGAEWTSLGIEPEKAQLLESRKLTKSEICGFYRVPAHLVGDQEKNSSWGTGIAEMGQSFVTYTLLTWMKRIEAEHNRKLFSRGDGYYVKHNAAALLRGDPLKRSQALEVQHRRGIITDNEWRDVEDRNPVEGGDVRHYPLSEGRVDEHGEDLPPPNDNPPASIKNRNAPPALDEEVPAEDPGESENPEGVQ